MTPTSTVRRVVSTRMPTKWGAFETLGFEREILNGSRRVETALAMILGDLTEGAPLIRIHSQCFTGEVLGSLAAPTPHSLAYLRAKKERMGHALGLGRQEHTRYPDHAPDRFEFATIETAVRELKAGRMIVVVDDEDRENEGDLTMAAELVTPEAINFMATHGRGLVCLAMPGERLDELDLAPMAPENTALHGTAFTISIDAKEGVTTGISAHDRAHTIKAAVDPASLAEDFARPGHVFPLRARPGGVLERRGQTEAAVDLAGLTGLSRAGVICEIVNDDGTMARVPDLIGFCKTHGLVMVTVADLARYRLESEYEGSLSVIDPFLMYV